MVDDAQRPKAFPKPRRISSGGIYRERSTPIPGSDPIAPAKRTVVTRAEPPEELDEKDPAATPTKLSKDEIKALLAVNETNTMTGWGKSVERFKVVVIPMGVGSSLAHLAFGWWGLGFVLAGGLLWTLVPMARQDREGWSAPSNDESNDSESK